MADLYISNKNKELAFEVLRFDERKYRGKRLNGYFASHKSCVLDFDHKCETIADKANRRKTFEGAVVALLREGRIEEVVVIEPKWDDTVQNIIQDPGRYYRILEL